ncbi:MAG: NeuD/PglB/VioB family sugar acetyltransferase [Weeksellaceae bacterium]|jgi:sugar O-acyltransferase (sialic acid O-acetyltransferase NeuD family)|nr:NeuD/PglB/VioB family sugar acetyltransferase [Weeksellaceae bacterium]
MLVIGAGGFAKEILEIVHQNNELDNLCFYDDVNIDAPQKLYNKFPVLKSIDEVEEYFKTVDNRFTIGIGNPFLRYKLFEKFSKVNGKLTSVISKFSEIGDYGVSIGDGCNILGGVKISNDVKIGKGTMIYYNSVITHDVEIGEFVEISPNVNVLGKAKIGNKTHIATGAIIFPDLKIGDNVIVGAGSIVTKNLPNNCTVIGSPAKIIKKGE